MMRQLLYQTSISMEVINNKCIILVVADNGVEIVDGVVQEEIIVVDKIL